MRKKRYTIDSSSLNLPYPASKKGQVTIFIILGILLLLSLTLVIFLRKELITFKPGEIIPTEKGKVENFLTSCLEKVGGEALQLVGVQGGYITIPSDVVNDYNARLQVSPAHMVPYWAYGQNVRIPSLLEIKEQMDDYIEKNMRACLFSHEAFQEAYDLIEKSDLISNTEIVEGKVIFNLRWEMEIRSKSGEVITELINHIAESPVRLKEVYEVSRSIVEKELGTLKLEDITQDLIALEHPEVPVAGMELSCAKKKWDPNMVRSTLLELIRINIRELKVQGTDYLNFPEELTYYQNHYVWNLGSDFKHPSVSVLFNFDQNYPYIFAVTPLNGNRMESSQLGGTDVLSFLCIQTWKFTYDIIYPVLVKVKDETTGYIFNTAFTVHLVRNLPSREEAVPRASYFTGTVNDEEYCGIMNIPMTVFTYELVENERTGVYNREPLEGAQTSFTCLKYKCEMLESEYDFAGRGHAAGYATNFPYCVGGILRGEKEGYKESWQRLVTAAGKEVELDLVPVAEVPARKITVVKHQLGSDGKAGPAKALSDEELSLVKLILRKKSDLPGRIFHESSIIKAKTSDEEVLGEETLEFLAQADFTYELDVSVLGQEKFIGGYKGNWDVSWDALRNAEEIVFHVVSRDGASEEQMFDLMLNLPEYSRYVPSPEIR